MDALTIILIGCLLIALKGARDLHRRVRGLELYASIVTDFAKNISDYPEEVVEAKFKQHTHKAFEKMRGN